MYTFGTRIEHGLSFNLSDTVALQQGCHHSHKGLLEKNEAFYWMLHLKSYIMKFSGQYQE